MNGFMVGCGEGEVIVKITFPEETHKKNAG
jgi:hypothetical protein